MKLLLISIRNLLFFTLLLGGLYPLTVTVIGKILSPIRSGGSIIRDNGKVIGSELIGQKFTSPKYFRGRPSTADYNPMSSSASQSSVTDKILEKDFADRRKDLGDKAPADMLYASGSGLDPHISVEAANLQKFSVMKERGLSEEIISGLIKKATDERFLGFMGQPRVNVLKLNLLLDKQ